MLFSFGKNASNNIKDAASHLKDVIEKTVNWRFFLNQNDEITIYL